MVEDNYSLKEACLFLKIPLEDLVRELAEGKIRHTEAEGQVNFSLTDLLDYQGYISLYSAKQYVANKLSRKKPRMTATEILDIGRREGILEIYTVRPQPGNPAYQRVYVKKRTLDRLLRSRTLTRDYTSFEEAMGYLRKKMEEKGFDEKDMRYLSQITQEPFWCKRGLSFPNRKERVKEAIDAYASSLYDPRSHVTVQQAAEMFYYQIKGSETKAERKFRSLFQVKELFADWARQGAVPAEKYLNPADNRKTYCFRREKVEKITENYLSGEETREEARKRAEERHQAYREILQIINVLRKGVARSAGTRLPKKIFLSKPQGRYGSIYYPPGGSFSGEYAEGDEREDENGEERKYEGGRVRKCR